MGLGKGVLANRRDLPGDLHIGGVSADGELVILNFLGNDRLREPAAVHCELVAEVAFFTFEPGGQCYGCEAEFIGSDIARGDIHHLGDSTEAWYRDLFAGSER